MFILTSKCPLYMGTIVNWALKSLISFFPASLEQHVYHLSQAILKDSTHHVTYRSMWCIVDQVICKLVICNIKFPIFINILNFFDQHITFCKIIHHSNFCSTIFHFFTTTIQIRQANRLVHKLFNFSLIYWILIIESVPSIHSRTWIMR